MSSGIFYQTTRTQHKNVDFKNIEMEKDFLGAILNNTNAFKKIINEFDSDVFTNTRVAKIYDKIFELYFKEGEIINEPSIIESLDVPNENKKVYDVFFKDLLKRGKKKSNLEYIIALKHRLEQLYDARISEIGMRDVLKNMREVMSGGIDKVDDIREIFLRVSNTLNKNKSKSVDVDPIKNFDSWIRNYNYYQSHPDEMIGIPTGIAPIDRVITGLRKSEFGLCVADTGVGKSIFLLDVAINCWLRCGDVLYVTIEMPAEQLENRFWCNLSGISYNKFRRLELNKADKAKIGAKVEQFKNHDFKFHIVDMPQGCTIKALSTKVEDYVKSNKIALIVVDYLNIISSEESGDVSLDWTSQVKLAMGMKQQIARKFCLPTWSACQVTGENLAFGRHIKDNIDLGVHFIEDEDSKITGVMDVEYIKTRDFAGLPHKINTDRELMRMWKTDDEKEIVKKKKTKLKNNGLRLIKA